MDATVKTIWAICNAIEMQVRVYELGQLSLKFERHFDADIIDFQVQSSAATPYIP